MALTYGGKWSTRPEKWSTRSCEEPMQEPARPVRLIGSGAVEPEAPPRLVLDSVIVAVIVAHLLGFRSASPPFAADALRPVGAVHAMLDAAPLEDPRRVIRHSRDGDDRLGSRQEPDRPPSRGIPTGAGERRQGRHRSRRAFGNVTLLRLQAVERRRAEAIGEAVDERGELGRIGAVTLAAFRRQQAARHLPHDLPALRKRDDISLRLARRSRRLRVSRGPQELAEPDLHRGKRLDPGGRQHHVLDAKAWIDLHQPLRQQALQMARIAARPRHADGNGGARPVDAVERQYET